MICKDQKLGTHTSQQKSKTLIMSQKLYIHTHTERVNRGEITGGNSMGVLKIINSILVNNDCYKDAIRAIREDVLTGRNMSKKFQEMPHLFPTMLTHMITVGEDTGDITSMLKLSGMDLENIDLSGLVAKFDTDEFDLSSLIGSLDFSEFDMAGMLAMLDNPDMDFESIFENVDYSSLGAIELDLTKLLDSLGIDLTNIPLEYTEQGMEDLNNVIQNLINQGLEQVDASTDKLVTGLGEARQASEQLSSSMINTGKNLEQLDEQARNTQAFAQRVAQFVGLEGGIQIARRAMRDAILKSQMLR